MKRERVTLVDVSVSTETYRRLGEMAARLPRNGRRSATVGNAIDFLVGFSDAMEAHARHDLETRRKGVT
jgi:hypothetical protein